MKNKKIKIGVLCLVLFLISFFVLQYINKPFTEYKTEFAENYTVSDEIQIKGVSIKDETIISKTQNGQICYIINDGSKVAKDQLIGYQYPDATQAIAKYKSIKKEDYIKTLENAKNKSTYANSNYEILSKQINQDIININKYSSKGFYQNFETQKNNYAYNSTKRELTINSSTDIEGSINFLKNEKAEIEKVISSKPQSINSPVSGYFISKVDGFEKNISEKGTNLTATDIDSFFENRTDQENYVGKFANSYKWNFVGIVNSKFKDKLIVGQSANVKFSFITSSDVPVTITETKVDEKDSSKMVVTLSCEYMTDEISVIHCQNAKIVLNKYTGLKIPKNALRFQEGSNTPGVYSIYNGKMYFKKLDILFENESVIISKYNDSDNTLLKIYDEVIVEGPDLYNEKPI